MDDANKAFYAMSKLNLKLGIFESMKKEIISLDIAYKIARLQYINSLSIFFSLFIFANEKLDLTFTY